RPPPASPLLPYTPPFRSALGNLTHLAARLESLAGKPDLTLKAGERALRDVRAALADLPPLPSKREHDELAQRLKTIQTTLAAKVDRKSTRLNSSHVAISY